MQDAERKRAGSSSGHTPIMFKLEDTSGFVSPDYLMPVFLAALGCVVAWFTISVFSVETRHLLKYQAAAMVFIGVSIMLARQGLTRMAAALFSVSIWALTQLPPYVTGHLTIPGVMLPLVSVLAAGLIWSTRAAIVLAGATSLIWLVALQAMKAGYLPDPQPRSDFQFWFIMTASLLMVSVFLHTSTAALRQALEQARDLAARTRRVMREAPDAILILDEDGAILDANPAVHRVSGILPSRLVGETLTSPGILSNADIDKVKRVFGAALDGSSSSPFEVDLLRPDGTTVVVEAKCHPVEWDGTPCLEVILRDITDRRRGERERLSHAEQSTFAHKMEAVGRLAGGVAHDFNNVLTIVSGCADLIREDPEASGSIIELAGEIQIAQERAAALTRRLLAFAQRQVVDPRPLSLSDEVLALAETLQTVVGPGITLDIAYSSEDTTVFLDAHQLEQILVNLVSNAHDAMAGQGTVQVRVHPITLDAPLRGAAGVAPPGSYVVLSVKDFGAGILKSDQDRVFDPFFSTKAGGSGLGLSAVLGIVQQARGQLTLSSAHGEGTRVSVYLPLYRQVVVLT